MLLNLNASCTASNALSQMKNAINHQKRVTYGILAKLKRCVVLVLLFVTMMV